MMSQRVCNLAAVCILLAGVLAFSKPACADEGGLKSGLLTCDVSSGWGFIFASTRDVDCNYSPKTGISYKYLGHISKFGVDIGYMSGGVLVWTVIAHTDNTGPDALTADYGGVGIGAAVGVGAGANVMISSSSHSIVLQPLSVEGDSGLDLSAGIATLSLEYQPG